MSLESAHALPGRVAAKLVHTPSSKTGLAIAASMSVFGAVLCLSLVDYITKSFAPHLAADDAQQQAWVFDRLAAHAASDDIYADYMLSVVLPAGFTKLVQAASALFSYDLIFRLNGVVALLACLLFLFLAGRSLASAGIGIAAVVLAIGADQFLSITAGGLPRATGLALLCGAVYGFVSGRLWLTALFTIAGAWLYYPTAVIGGALFAVGVLLAKQVYGTEQARLGWRLMAVVAVGTTCVVLMAPRVLTPSRFGQMITAHDQSWPEAGPGGRFSNDQQLGGSDWGRIVLKAGASAAATQSGQGVPWIPSEVLGTRARGMISILLVCSTIVLLLLRARHDLVSRRLLVLVAVSGVLFTAAALLVPKLYIPGRYLYPMLPIFVALALPYLVWSMANSFSDRQRWIVLGGAIILVSLMIAGRPSQQGLTVSLSASEQEVLTFLKTAPAEGLVAGWPHGLLDKVPLFSGRAVLASFELSLAWHTSYTAEVRQRTDAVIRAWFAQDAAPLHVLRDRWNVSYFVFDKVLLDDPGLNYFHPFDELIDKLKSDSANSRINLRSIKLPIDFENDRFLVMRLK